MKNKVILFGLCCIILLVVCGCGNNQKISDNKNETIVSVFYFDNSTSNNLFETLESLSDEYNLKIVKYNIYENENDTLMKNVGKAFNENVDYIPYVIINNYSINPYKIERDNEIRELIKQESNNEGKNIVEKIKNGETIDNLVKDNSKEEDTIPPKEKFIKYITTTGGYTDLGNNTYTDTTGHLVFTIDLNNKVFSVVGAGGSIQDTEYYFLNDKASYKATYNGLTINIDYTPSTNKYTCNSNSNSGCNNIDSYLTNIKGNIDMFDDYIKYSKINVKDLAN